MGKIEDSVVNRVINAKNPGIVCDRCSCEEITEISYGLPGWIIVDEPIDPRIQTLIDESRIVLGGCVMRNDSPKYFCRKCKNKFGKVDIKEY